MNITANRAICLHAEAEDLRFLNPARNRMSKLLGQSFRGLSFGDQNSLIEARLTLQRAHGYLVVIFAHGGSSYVRGGEYSDRLTREIVEGGKLLSIQEVHMLRGKMVFCLSCDSNGLASACIDAGAHAFVGFDAIPFNRYDATGCLIRDNAIEHHAQQLIADGVKAALERFVTGRLTLDEAVEFLRLWICKEVVRFVRDMVAVKQRREIAALVLRMKDGMRFHGKSGVRFTHLPSTV